MKIPGVPSVRLTRRSSLYVVAVALIAAVGFTGQSPWPILLAALLAVPASIVAVPCYYLAYGFLGLIPGANPSSNSGSATFAPDGRMLTSVSTGMPAAWFTITTFVLGILALTFAAFVNVLLLRALSARRRGNESYWDRQAPTYDTRMAGVERRFFADSRSWVCGRARGATLEIAIGTGANLSHYPGDVDLTGIDWSPAMLDVARRQAERVHRAVTLRQADSAALPFPAESFDTVVSTFALCCIPDEHAALVEALRVLRPGGRLLLADHIGASFWPLRALQHAVDLVSVPLQGEHYTRRPATTLRGLGVTTQESERLTMGAIERVHVRKPL